MCLFLQNGALDFRCKITVFIWYYNFNKNKQIDHNSPPSSRSDLLSLRSTSFYTVLQKALRTLGSKFKIYHIKIYHIKLKIYHY